MTDRAAAWGLLTEFTESESLRKHALAVEACMRAYARKFAAEGKVAAGDEEKWAITGLLHDFDYEKYPTAEEHPFVGNKILREKGYPEDVMRVVNAIWYLPDGPEWRATVGRMLHLVIDGLRYGAPDRQPQPMR